MKRFSVTFLVFQTAFILFSTANIFADESDVSVKTDSILNIMDRIQAQNPDSAIQYGIRIALEAEKNNAILTLASVLGRIGYFYFRQNNFISAIEFYIRAYPYAKATGNHKLLGFLLIDIGNSYYKQGLLPEATDMYIESEKIFSKAGLQSERAVALNNLGLCKIRTGEYDEAEKFFRQGLSLREKIGDSLLVLHSYGYLLDILRLKKMFGEADKLINSSIAFHNSTPLKTIYDYGIHVETIRKIALLKKEMCHYEDALSFLDLALNIKPVDKGDNNLLSQLYLEKADILEILDNEKGFLNNIALCEKYANEINNLRLQLRANELYAKHFERKNDLKKSIFYLKEVTRINSKISDSFTKNRLLNLFSFVSTFDIENQLKLSRLELIRATEKKQAIQLQLYFLVAGIILISLFFFLLYKNNLKLKKLNSELEERNAEITRQREEISIQKANIEFMLEELQQINRSRDKFYSVFVHDLKNPLYALVSFSEILKNEFDDLSEQEKKRFIKNNYELAIKINSLIMDMLEWLSIQLGKTKIITSPVSPKHIADIVITSIHKAASDKNIRIVNIIPDEVRVMADITSLTSIMQNLLQNAIKFSHPGSEVIINYSRNAGKVNLIFEDQGVGFTEEQIRLFNSDELIPTTEGTSQELGTGFGLVIIKDLLKLNNGSLLLESTKNKGSKFTVILDEAPNT